MRVSLGGSWELVRMVKEMNTQTNLPSASVLSEEGEVFDKPVVNFV